MPKQIDNSLLERLAAARSAKEAVNRSSSFSTTGGDGPYDPRMEARIGALESDMKDVKQSLKSLEISCARIESTLSALATKSDVATVAGNVAALSERVNAQTTRLVAVEDSIKNTVSVALSKTIGVVGVVTMFGTMATIIGVVFGILRYTKLI